MSDLLGKVLGKHEVVRRYNNNNRVPIPEDCIIEVHQYYDGVSNRVAVQINLAEKSVQIQSKQVEKLVNILLKWLLKERARK